MDKYIHDIKAHQQQSLYFSFIPLFFSWYQGGKNFALLFFVVVDTEGNMKPYYTRTVDIIPKMNGNVRKNYVYSG